MTRKPKSVQEVIRKVLSEELEDTLRLGMKWVQLKTKEALDKAADRAARAVILDAKFEDVEMTRFLPGAQGPKDEKKKEAKE